MRFSLWNTILLWTANSFNMLLVYLSSQLWLCVIDFCTFHLGCTTLLHYWFWRLMFHILHTQQAAKEKTSLNPCLFHNIYSGHSCLTYSLSLKGEEPPVWYLTLEHIKFYLILILMITSTWALSWHECQQHTLQLAFPMTASKLSHFFHFVVG